MAAPHPYDAIYTPNAVTETVRYTEDDTFAANETAWRTRLSKAIFSTDRPEVSATPFRLRRLLIMMANYSLPQMSDLLYHVEELVRCLRACDVHTPRFANRIVDAVHDVHYGNVYEFHSPDCEEAHMENFVLELYKQAILQAKIITHPKLLAPFHDVSNLRFILQPNPDDLWLERMAKRVTAPILLHQAALYADNEHVDTVAAEHARALERLNVARAKAKRAAEQKMADAQKINDVPMNDAPAASDAHADAEVPTKRTTEEDTEHASKRSKTE